MEKTLARARIDELQFLSSVIVVSKRKRKRFGRLAQSATAYVAQVLNRNTLWPIHGIETNCPQSAF